MCSSITYSSHGHSLDQFSNDWLEHSWIKWEPCLKTPNTREAEAGGSLAAQLGSKWCLCKGIQLPKRHGVWGVQGRLNVSPGLSLTTCLGGTWVKPESSGDSEYNHDQKPQLLRDLGTGPAENMILSRIRSTRLLVLRVNHSNLYFLSLSLSKRLITQNVDYCWKDFWRG